MALDSAAALAAARIGLARGVTLPPVLREVKPAYTADAMRAKVQGSVWLECIVMPDGSVGEVKVTRSLDPIFGLDQEAIKAAKMWKFRPGHAAGRAGPGHHHDRADLHASIDASAEPAARSLRLVAHILVLVVPFYAPAQALSRVVPAPVEGDFVARDFAFTSGERLPEVKIHYRTVGTPRKDADGVVRNGVLILHGTGGTGAGFLGAGYGGRLFGKGQPLDAEKYFIILPDNVGHGQSSKPSDGLRMKFPKYRYTDMVKLQHELVTKGLGLTNLKLVMGTSMGAMHAWNWGYMYPGFAAGLVPLASNPGRDRRPQPRVAQVPDRRDRNRSDVEERRLHRAAARAGQRDRVPDDGDQRAAAVAEAVPDDCRRRTSTSPIRSRRDRRTPTPTTCCTTTTRSRTTTRRRTCRRSRRRCSRSTPPTTSSTRPSCR